MTATLKLNGQGEARNSLSKTVRMADRARTRLCLTISPTYITGRLYITAIRRFQTSVENSLFSRSRKTKEELAEHSFIIYRQLGLLSVELWPLLQMSSELGSRCRDFRATNSEDIAGI